MEWLQGQAREPTLRGRGCEKNKRLGMQTCPAFRFYGATGLLPVNRHAHRIDNALDHG